MRRQRNLFIVRQQARAAPVADHVILPAEQSLNDSAFRKIAIARGFDDAKRAAANHVADLNRRQVGVRRVHPAAIRWVERQVNIAYQKLAVIQLRQARFNEIEITILNQSDRARGKPPLPIHFCSHSRSPPCGVWFRSPNEQCARQTRYAQSAGPFFMFAGFVSLSCDYFRLYVPIRLASASVWPFIASSSCCFVLPAGRLSVVSSA